MIAQRAATGKSGVSTGRSEITHYVKLHTILTHHSPRKTL
jgi:hypothetical protein